MKTPLHKIDAELCRRSFYYFIQQFWSIVIPEQPVYNWHIEELANELQQIAQRAKERSPKEGDVVINIPPGTSKSTICTIMFPAWCWIIDPTLRILTASYSASLSTDHAVKSRDIIKSDKYKLFFPKIEIKQDQDNKMHYKNENGGERYVTSVGGTVTGFHAHIIIVDDPINPQESLSKVAREEAVDFMDRTLSTRKVDKLSTVTVLIMQRVHEGDPTGNWLSKPDKKIIHFCLPAELSDNVRPEKLKSKYVDGLLDPLRLSRETLAQMRIDLGSYGYSGQMQQLPTPKGGGILKKEWFGRISWEEFQKLDGAKNVTWDFFIDSAYTAKQDNDPSALIAVCNFKNNLYIRMSKQVWLEFPELLTELKSFTQANGYSVMSRIFVEPKASGLSIVQTIRNQTRLNIVALESPKDDKVTRVAAISPIIESKRVFFIAGQWNNNVIEECAAFPTGAHDDQVDTLTHALQKYYGKPSAYKAPRISVLRRS